MEGIVPDMERFLDIVLRGGRGIKKDSGEVSGDGKLMAVFKADY